LRAAVVGAGEWRDTVRGRTLLARKGMAAWMNGGVVAAPPGTAPSKACAARQLPTGIEQALVDLLATMAFATAREVIA
jgi:hypothetical protein